MSFLNEFQKILLVVFMVCVCLGSHSFACAGERTVIDGIVQVTEDPNGNIVEVKVSLLSLVEEDEFSYKIILDENGKKMGKEMNGKWVEVIGDITMDDNSPWLEVKSYTYFGHKSDR